MNHSGQPDISCDYYKQNLPPHLDESQPPRELAMEEKQTSEPSPTTTEEPAFTVFTIWERRWIVFLSAFAGMFSPMSSFIFYPAITAISDGLNVSVGLVNLAITTYMVVSGVAPSLLGNAADKLGRRPVYILTLGTYLVANIGLALQNNYPALLALRMLQSAGSSGELLPSC